MYNNCKLTPQFKRIGPYIFNLNALIGKGSYGNVYQGKHELTNEIVAIKMIEKKLHQIDTFYNEIDIMKSLKNENIVHFIDCIMTNRNIYIITEYCNGPDLKLYLKQNKIDEEKAINLLKQIIKGLKHIINNNFIHRDLKPANIIFNNEILKITDFGFSRSIDTLMVSIVGTPIYMAPQILLKQQYSTKCDIWSLGVIYFEMLFGRTPWIANDLIDLINKLQNSKLEIPSYPKISQNSINFLQGCLQQKENDRYNWIDIFDHPLIKPKLNLHINSFTNDQNSNSKYQSYKYKTYRDRSNSNQIIEITHEEDIKTQYNTKIQKLSNNLNNICKKDILKLRRAQSKCEYIFKQENYIKQPINNKIKQEKKINYQKQNKSNINTGKLIIIVQQIKEKAEKKGYQELQDLMNNQMDKLSQLQLNYKEEIKKINKFKDKFDGSLKNTLEIYIKLLKLQNISKENDNYFTNLTIK